MRSLASIGMKSKKISRLSGNLNSCEAEIQHLFTHKYNEIIIQFYNNIETFLSYKATPVA